MEKASDVINGIYEKAEEKTGDGVRRARERVRSGVRQAEEMIDTLADHVTRNPLSSLGWAVAVGIAAGIGLAKLSNSHPQHPFLDRVKEGVEAGERSWRQIRSGAAQVLSGLKAAAADVRS